MRDLEIAIAELIRSCQAASPCRGMPEYPAFAHTGISWEMPGLRASLRSDGRALTLYPLVDNRELPTERLVEGEPVISGADPR